MPVKEFKSNKLERESAFQQRMEEEQEIEEEEVGEEEEGERGGNNDMVEERPPIELFESIFGDEETS